MALIEEVNVSEALQVLSLRSQIASWLTGCRRLAVLGIGNLLRGDDAIGMEIAKLLRGQVSKKVRILECETVPENFLGYIEQSKPTHVLMIDAAQLEAEPGEARLIPAGKISGVALSTHALPLSLTAEVIQKSIDAKVVLLGIQPETVEFKEGLSPRLQKTSKDIASIIAEVTKQIL